MIHETVDPHLGRRLRRRRKIMGLSQRAVGAACGIRFQQVHKYERACNQVSAAMLWKLARALGVEIQYFYDGLGRQSHGGTMGEPRPRDEAG